MVGLETLEDFKNVWKEHITLTWKCLDEGEPFKESLFAKENNIGALFKDLHYV